MKSGDFAGLGALQRRYGFVGVTKSAGAKSIVMISAETDRPVELESITLEQNVIYLRIDCDYRDRVDTAHFFYSLDGDQWTAIGKPLKMAYTLPHFMAQPRGSRSSPRVREAPKTKHSAGYFLVESGERGRESFSGRPLAMWSIVGRKRLPTALHP